jgi:hypothetical protein
MAKLGQRPTEQSPNPSTVTDLRGRQIKQNSFGEVGQAGAVKHLGILELTNESLRNQGVPSSKHSMVTNAVEVRSQPVSSFCTINTAFRDGHSVIEESQGAWACA